MFVFETIGEALLPEEQGAEGPDQSPDPGICGACQPPFTAMAATSCTASCFKGRCCGWSIIYCSQCSFDPCR